MSQTPGRWKIGFEDGVSAGLLDRNPGYIAVTAPSAPFAFGCVVAITEREPDARLIAAAPDLLDALKAVKETCPCDPDINPQWYAAWTALEAAIAKAEGHK